MTRGFLAKQLKFFYFEEKLVRIVRIMNNIIVFQYFNFRFFVFSLPIQQICQKTTADNFDNRLVNVFYMPI